MPLGKKEVVHDGNLGNTLTDTPTADILEYETTLI